MLTKDNLLIKRNCHGSKTCCFCHEEEMIQHLFFDCRFTRFIWSFPQIAFNLTKPQSVTHMSGSWLNGVTIHLRSLFLLGAALTCWSFWLHRNDLVFKKKKN
jgi:hypothetical protein